MLRTKCILAPHDDSDGYRLSVMSRHTLNDGITPHPSIIEHVSYDSWLKSLAPPSKLVGDYYLRDLSFEDYTSAYLEYIRTPEVSSDVKKLAELSIDGIVTLLCIEDTPEFCHRRLLAEECKRYEPSLELCIN